MEQLIFMQAVLGRTGREFLQKLEQLVVICSTEAVKANLGN